ncbi:MAG: hypothetical protein ABI551_17125, partial [Polyangiaceae bacterium]
REEEKRVLNHRRALGVREELLQIDVFHGGYLRFICVVWGYWMYVFVVWCESNDLASKRA